MDPESLDKLIQNLSSPDFRLLTLEYPILQQYILKANYDYRNLEAVYVLTTVLLNKYFGLVIELDRTHLCPRLANRLDYVKWLVEILAATVPGSNVVGLDVGVGASCIYPLLACTIFPSWKMYGTDVNERSLAVAYKNLQDNAKVASKITLRQVLPGAKLFDLDHLRCSKLSFAMCNPPFYASLEELEESKAKKIGSPFTALSAVDSELFTEGGELTFTLRMVKESLVLRNAITWYTTMLGKKETLVKLVARLRELAISNYILHEINQGSKTKRWIVGWSFDRYHPRDYVARINTPSLKGLNSHFTEMKFATGFKDSNMLLATIRDVLSELEPYLKWVSDTCIFKVESRGDVWSRSFRRRLKKSEEPFSEEIVEFELSWSFTFEVNVWWKFGNDHKIFESFLGMMKQKLNN